MIHAHIISDFPWFSGQGMVCAFVDKVDGTLNAKRAEYHDEEDNEDDEVDGDSRG